MNKLPLLTFILGVLIFSISGAYSIQETSKDATIQEDPDIYSLNAGDSYCWKCVNNKIEIFQVKLISENGCYDEDFNLLKYSDNPSLNGLVKTPEIEKIISQSETLEQLSGKLYENNILDCQISSIKEGFDTTASIIDSDKDGIIDSTDTINGLVKKEITLTIAGTDATFYPGTTLKFSNGAWTAYPGNNPGEKNYITFNNQEVPPLNEGSGIKVGVTLKKDLETKANDLKNPVTASPDKPVLNANAANVIKGLDVFSFLNNLLKKFTGLFA